MVSRVLTAARGHEGLTAPKTGSASKTVVVTGAARGLGFAAARRLCDDGYRIVVADIDVERGADAVGALRLSGGDASFVTVDISVEESVRSLVARVRELAVPGVVWGVVNNAALADAVGGKTFDQLDAREWDRVMSVNVRGTWLVSRALLPLVRSAGSGRFVNIASDAALYGSPRLAHYVASKGAVIALTRAMARELGDEGITVNCIAPGLTEGESSQRIPRERHELYARNRAITRAQQASDVVGAVSFLISADAAFITGQTLVVDGGFVML